MSATSKILQFVEIVRAKDSSAISPITWFISAFTNLSKSVDDVSDRNWTHSHFSFQRESTQSTSTAPTPCFSPTLSCPRSSHRPSTLPFCITRNQSRPLRRPRALAQMFHLLENHCWGLLNISINKLFWLSIIQNINVRAEHENVT